MEDNQITMLKDIDVSKSDYNIKVRVIRRWTTPDYSNPKDYYSLELIVQDEENTRMQCSVVKKFARPYDKLLDENVPVVITKPSLGLNRSKYKHVPNDQKIVFKMKTKVTVPPTFSGNPFGFVFANFQDIWARTVSEDALIDVIGVITKVFERQNPAVNNTKIQINDLNNLSINVTLWDSYNERFEKFMKDNPDAKNVVIVLQFAKHNWYLGEPNAANSYAAARLWINEDIEDINVFKSSLLGNNVDEGSTSTQSLADSIVSCGANLEYDFLKKIKFSFISDIHDVKEPSFLIILGTIKGIEKDSKWCYDSCSKCFKSVDVSADRKLVTCENEKCQAVDVTAITRYRVSLRVQDSTGTATATMFDRDAERLLGISAAELLKDSDEFEGEELFPKRLNTLLERKLAFKIHVNSFNLDKNVEFYTISKVSEDTAILSILDQKFEADVATDNVTYNQGAADKEISAHNSVFIKDSISSTADNVTPASDAGKSDLSKKCFSTTSPTDIDQVSGMKRNLAKVYEVDDISPQSTSKSRSSSESEEILLIPKSEKKD